MDFTVGLHPPRATPRYALRAPRGQVNLFPKESLTKQPGPAVDPAGSARGGGTLITSFLFSFFFEFIIYRGYSI